MISSVFQLLSRLLGGDEGVWRAWCWLVLSLCVLSSTASFALGFIGAKCGQRFHLMTAMGFSCSVSFLYRIYLLSATLTYRYSTTFASPVVHLLLFSSSIATTVFYTCLVEAAFHTFVAVCLHPSQYDPLKMSRAWVRAAIVVGVGGAAYKWFLTSGDVEPSPLLADGKPWQPRVRFLWFEYSPLKAKPHSYVNLFLLMVIGAACPVFLTYVLVKMLALRREAKERLGNSAKCSIRMKHIYRCVVTLFSMIFLSVTSVVTILLDGSRRHHRHLNLHIQPTARDLVLRYTFSSATGVFLFLIYITGDELQQTMAELIHHCALKQRKLPCKCRRCVSNPEKPAADFVPSFQLQQPIGEEMDFFAALKAAGVEAGRSSSIPIESNSPGPDLPVPKYKSSTSEVSQPLSQMV